MAPHQRLLALALLAVLGTSGQPLAQKSERSAAELMDVVMWNREPIGGPFALTDQYGAPRTDADFRGKFISVEAIAELLRAGWPVTIQPERPRDATGISVAALGTILDIFSHSEYGIGRFEISVPVGIPVDHAFGLEMRLTQWTWRLANIRLPQQVSAILAEEIAKSVKGVPPTP